MAVAPLQLPGYAAPQSLDFTSLANLGQVYKTAQNERGLRDAFAGGVPTDAAGLAQLGAQVGAYNPQLGLSLAQLGMNAGQREQDRERQARLDERQLSRDAQAQKNADRAFGLQQRQFEESQDYSPQERAKMAAQYGIDPQSPQGRAFILTGKLPDAEGANAASLTPVYGVGPDGKPAMVQPTKSGVAVQTKLPEGFQISRDPIRVDLGTHIQLLDPQTRQPIGVMKKDVAGVEQAKIEGDARGTANVALPQVEASSQQILKTIDDIQKHPGKQYSLGIYSKLPTVPGTSQANFRAAAGQLKGQTFLQAYQTLKGGGAITDVEGAKGENALARLDQAQTTEAYDAALNDFKTVIKAGIERARAKAKGVGAAASPDSTAADPLGIR